jgi:hypothetical protein
MPKDLSFPPDPVVDAFRKDVDRRLIRENLKLSEAGISRRSGRNSQGTNEEEEAGTR